MDEVPQEGSWVIYSVFQYSWSIESLDLSDSKAHVLNLDSKFSFV